MNQNCFRSATPLATVLSVLTSHRQDIPWKKVFLPKRRRAIWLAEENILNENEINWILSPEGSFAQTGGKSPQPTGKYRLRTDVKQNEKDGEYLELRASCQNILVTFGVELLDDIPSWNGIPMSLFPQHYPIKGTKGNFLGMVLACQVILLRSWGRFFFQGSQFKALELELMWVFYIKVFDFQSGKILGFWDCKRCRLCENFWIWTILVHILGCWHIWTSMLHIFVWFAFFLLEMEPQKHLRTKNPKTRFVPWGPISPQFFQSKCISISKREMLAKHGAICGSALVLAQHWLCTDLPAYHWNKQQQKNYIIRSIYLFSIFPILLQIFYYCIWFSRFFSRALLLARSDSTSHSAMSSIHLSSGLSVHGRTPLPPL